MFYGLMLKEDAVVAARAVCEVIGSPATRENAVALLVETAAAETLLGELRDPTMYGAGTGLTQVDKGTFDWLKGMYANTPTAEAIQKRFNIDISRTQYQELETSPVLAMIFCRLRYLRAQGAIPDTLVGRAEYWKKWYNTSAGKGTVAGYIKKVQDCGVAALLRTA
ncbi:hypothetical protein [Pseudomonas phage PSA28]|nr:hypothetical protein [Pseudomonas phage PSA28]